MNKYFYFKRTFLSISAGLFTGILIYGLFDIDFSNNTAIIKLIFKSLVVSFIVGAILGLLNMVFKIGNFQKKITDNI